MTPSTVTITLRRGLTAPDCEGFWLARHRDGKWRTVEIRLWLRGVPSSGLLILDRTTSPRAHFTEFCGPLPSEPPAESEG